MPEGHDVLTVACLPVPPLGHVVEQPVRESNPPFRLEGPVSCTDRRTSHVECDEQELNLQVLWGRLGYGQLGLPMPNRRIGFQWCRRESNPHTHEGLSFAALPICVPHHRFSALDGI